MFAWLNNRNTTYEKVAEQVTLEKAVYRDELSTKRSSSAASCKAGKKSVRFADSEATNFREEKKEKEMVKGRGNEIGGRGIRVKVKMTKEEAARLLSKCKQGGVLDFKDLARELVALPHHRVSVLSTSTKDD